MLDIVFLECVCVLISEFKAETDTVNDLTRVENNTETSLLSVSGVY